MFAKVVSAGVQHARERDVAEGGTDGEPPAKLAESMGSVVAAAMAAAAAGRKLQLDLSDWQRGHVEKWFRQHGVLILSYYTLGALAYWAFEDWGPLRSAYYLTATATTNGDISPASPSGRLFSCVYILLGISVVMGGISPLAEFFLEWSMSKVLAPLASVLAARSDEILATMETASVTLERHVAAELAKAALENSYRRWAAQLVPLRFLALVRSSVQSARSEARKESHPPADGRSSLPSRAAGRRPTLTSAHSKESHNSSVEDVDDDGWDVLGRYERSPMPSGVGRRRQRWGAIREGAPASISPRSPPPSPPPPPAAAGSEPAFQLGVSLADGSLRPKVTRTPAQLAALDAARQKANQLRAERAGPPGTAPLSVAAATAAWPPAACAAATPTASPPALPADALGRRDLLKRQMSERRALQLKDPIDASSPSDPTRLPLRLGMPAMPARVMPAAVPLPQPIGAGSRRASESADGIGDDDKELVSWRSGLAERPPMLRQRSTLRGASKGETPPAKPTLALTIPAHVHTDEKSGLDLMNSARLLMSKITGFAEPHAPASSRRPTAPAVPAAAPTPAPEPAPSVHLGVSFSSRSDHPIETGLSFLSPSLFSWGKTSAHTITPSPRSSTAPGLAATSPAALEHQPAASRASPSPPPSAAPSGTASGTASAAAGIGATRRLVPTRHVASHMFEYIRAAMLFLLVLAFGLSISCGVHGYSWVDGLYWTIGCMTTAGGDLEATSKLLQVLYILYMPLAAVAMLTVARIVLQASLRLDIRRDNYALKIYSLLLDEAKEKMEPDVTMREADFVLAVLKARSLIDTETLEAIRTQFGEITRRHRPRGAPASAAVVDAIVVFDHLVQQKRVRSVEAYQEANGGQTPPTDEAHGDERHALVYVHTRTPDRGFKEWYEAHWECSVLGTKRMDDAHDGAYDGGANGSGGADGGDNSGANGLRLGDNCDSALFDPGDDDADEKATLTAGVPASRLLSERGAMVNARPPARLPRGATLPSMGSAGRMADAGSYRRLYDA